MKKKPFKYEIYLGMNTIEQGVAVFGYAEEKQITAVESCTEEELKMFWAMARWLVNSISDEIIKRHPEIMNNTLKENS